MRAALFYGPPGLFTAQVDAVLSASQFSDYSGLRAYAGNRKIVTITGANFAGNFYLDENDNASPDNGGTVIVDSSGRRWKRRFTGPANALWFYIASETTSEGMINRAIAAHLAVYVPAGVYTIDANVGVIVRTGTILTGETKNRTIFSGKLGTGGTLAELAAYSKGSIIRRAFNPLGSNAYVNDGYIADIGVVLNHPEAEITTTAIQIGFDMRNLTGFTVERCHAGNIPPVGSGIEKNYSKPFLVQGYPVVFGNVSGSDPAYAGGEKNRFINNTVFGGYKPVVQDDTALSPNSASYGTVIRENDIQTGHVLISQMGQYGAGNMHIGNILQDICKQNGDVSPSYVQYYDGYNNIVQPAYIEAGSNCDYQLFLDVDANNNKIDMLMAGVSSGNGDIVDNSNPNSNNRIMHCGEDGISGSVELFNKAYVKAWVKFYWDGSQIVYIKKRGVIDVVRTDVGDYLINWEKPFYNAEYMPHVEGDSNASGAPFDHNIYSHSDSNLRILTFNEIITNPIDPRVVWVSGEQ